MAPTQHTCGLAQQQGRPDVCAACQSTILAQTGSGPEMGRYRQLYDPRSAEATQRYAQSQPQDGELTQVRPYRSCRKS